MRSKLFIDSDVVIDLFTDRKHFANSASELFDLAEQNKLQLYLSTLSVSNIYYIVESTPKSLYL